VTRTTGRKAKCSKADARTKLKIARSHIQTGRLVVDDESIDGTDTTAASLAVLAGIAASDAACCAVLAEYSRGQDHREALRLLATIQPNGEAMAKHLRRLLEAKDASHYGLNFIGRAKARRLLDTAKLLVDEAQAVLER